MTKQNGLAWTTLGVDDSAGSLKDLRNDITNFSFSTPRAVQDVTGVDKSAMERLLLLADFSITMNGVFNASTADKSHDVFKTIPSTSVTRTVSLGFASKTLSNECVLTDYALTRGQDGSFTWTVPGVLSDGTVPTWG